MAPCVTAGGGGGMLGGVDLDCVFTSAGESGMVAARVSALSAGRGHGAVSEVCRAAPRFPSERGSGWGQRRRSGTLGWPGHLCCPVQDGNNPRLGQSSGSRDGAWCPVCLQDGGDGDRPPVHLHNGGDGALCLAWMQGGGDRAGHRSAPAAPALPHARGTARPSTRTARASLQSHRCHVPAPSCQRLPAHVSGIPGCPLTHRRPRQLHAGLP